MTQYLSTYAFFAMPLALMLILIDTIFDIEFNKFYYHGIATSLGMSSCIAVLITIVS